MVAPLADDIDGYEHARFARNTRVSTLHLRALAEAVQEAGVTVMDWVARVGFDAARLADSDAWYPLEEYERMVLAAVELTRDDAFGLHWGERSPMMQFELAPPLVATAATLRGAIEDVLRLQPILITHPECRARDEHGCLVLECDIAANSPLALRVRTEFALAGLLRLIGYFGERSAVRQINVAYPRPAYGDEYDRVFGDCLRFEQPHSGLTIEGEALDRPKLHRNVALHDVLRERTEHLRLIALGQLGSAARITQYVRSCLPRLPTMLDAASHLGMSERSLRRRLDEEDTSFRAIVDDVQRELAYELVAGRQQPMKQIAAAIGFSSLSGFERAFRRWTGSAPRRSKL